MKSWRRKSDENGITPYDYYQTLMRPKLSVVMPVWNGEKFLASALARNNSGY